MKLTPAAKAAAIAALEREAERLLNLARDPAIDKVPADPCVASARP